MKKRPISRLVLFNIVTLGIYELVWLVKIRNEIVSKFGYKLPKAWLLVVAEGVQLASIVGLILILFVVIPVSNHKIESTPRPSPQCLIDYAKSADTVRASGNATVSTECRNTYDNYYAVSQSSSKLLGLSFAGILAVFIVAILLGFLVLRKWLTPLALAIERITNGSMSVTTCLLLLVFAPPTVAMAAIQADFNKLATPSAR